MCRHSVCVSVGQDGYVGVYRVDLHSHTGHSKDSLLPASQLLDTAVKRGISAIAVTDHNSLGGARQAAALVARRGYGDLRILPGSEIKTREGEIIGLLIEKDVPRGLSPEETIAAIREQNGLVIVPHPCDRLRGSRLTAVALTRVAHLVDAIEGFNARTILKADNLAAQQFARERDLPVTAGSDAHVAQEAGAAYLVFQEPASLDSMVLLDQIRHAALGGVLSPPSVHVWSKIATWRKRLGIAPAIQL